MGENTAPIQSADLSGIIERLEKATVPDRELDSDFHNAVYGTAYIRVPASVTGFFTAVGDNGCPTVPYFTGSVDAAIALAERVLPAGTDISVKTQIAGKFHHCEIEGDFGDAGALNRPTLPIAICLATLRALQSKGEA